MTEADQQMPAASPPPSAAVRATGALAVAGALALAALLAVRPLASPDLGYHLAYGQTFLDTGRIVDTNEFIYTLPAAGESRPEPGPGCWYDDAGRYRFANANWLSQIIMAGAHRLASWDGLCALQAGLVAGVFLLMWMTTRRLGVPSPLAAAGILLAAMTAYGRFGLRPEVFGYLVLAGQLLILVRPELSRVSIAALIALQLLLVNLHSYFLLGPAITGAMLAGEAVASALARKAPPQRRQLLRARLRRLGIVLAAQVAVCFVNPWTWRLAILPAQTLVFLAANDITGADLSAGGHPWSHIGEFFRPFAGAFLHTKTTAAYSVLLALAAGGGVAAVLKRRWGWALAIGGLTAMSLSMRRNIAPAAFLIAPLALAACCQALARPWSRLSGRRRDLGRVATAGAVFLVSLYFALGVVSQRFYFSERSPIRFGHGLSRLDLPLGAASALGRLEGPGRLWTDYTSSSNIHYFTPGRPGVPILTNTWAYPPAVMREVIETGAGMRPFEPVADKYDLGAVALLDGRSTAPLIARLAGDERWRLVYLDGRYLVFSRAGGAERAIREGDLREEEYVEHLKTLDPAPAFSLYLGGLTLYHLGWDRTAASVFAAAVETDETYHEAWNMRGVCLARLGTIRLNETGDKSYLLRAQECFRRALAVKPGYEPAERNHAAVTVQLTEGRGAKALWPAP